MALDFRGLLDTAARTMSTGMVIAEVPSGRILFKNQETDRIFGEVAPDVQLFADFDGAERFAPTLQLAANQDEGDAGSLGNYTTIPRNARLPVWSAIETGQLLRFENLAALKDAYLDAPVRSNYKAWAVIPFAVGGRGVGAVSFSFEHERTFSEEDRGMLMALSGQASLAFARCMLLDAERRVRADAEAARARERQLHELAARLSSALTPEQVASAACEEAVAVLGALSAVIAVRSGDDQSHELRILGIGGYAVRVANRPLSVPMDAVMPVAEAIRRSETVWCCGETDLAACAPVRGGADQ